MVNKIGIVLIMSLIWLLLFFNLWLFNWWNNDDKNIILEIKTHNWQNISDLLNNDNYNKIWINPNKYEDFEWFLKDFKSFSWVTIDPIKEKFVVCVNDKADDNRLYIAFDYKYNWKVFDNEEYKNLAILDIYSAYKNDCIYWWVDSKAWKKILFETDFVHPKTSIINDVFSMKKNVYSIIATLSKSKNAWVLNKELLWYLYDFTWNYEEWLKERSELCKVRESLCNNNIKINVSWVVNDLDWNWIKWVEISLLNNSKYKTFTDTEWKYDFDINVYNLSHLRFKASLDWYSDAFKTAIVNNNKIKEWSLRFRFNMQKADKSYTINWENLSKYKVWWKYFVIKDDNSKYFIPLDGLYYSDWEQYKDFDLTVYTYLFTKQSSTEDMLANDTFQPVFWYVWNIMKTFGMPYIQFIDNKSWEELFVKASNPMILQNHIYHMKELYENYDKIYEPITDEDMEFLVKYSKEKWGYPITFDFLTENNLLRWPWWWALDRKKGIWESVPSRVLDTSWLVELPFYSINDK